MAGSASGTTYGYAVQHALSHTTAPTSPLLLSHPSFCPPSPFLTTSAAPPCLVPRVCRGVVQAGYHLVPYSAQAVAFASAIGLYSGPLAK